MCKKCIKFLSRKCYSRDSKFLMKWSQFSSFLLPQNIKVFTLSQNFKRHQHLGNILFLVILLNPLCTTLYKTQKINGHFAPTYIFLIGQSVKLFSLVCDKMTKQNKTNKSEQRQKQNQRCVQMCQRSTRHSCNHKDKQTKEVKKEQFYQD